VAAAIRWRSSVVGRHTQQLPQIVQYLAGQVEELPDGAQLWPGRRGIVRVDLAVTGDAGELGVRVDAERALV
jgi:hypothetical protein